MSIVKNLYLEMNFSHATCQNQKEVRELILYHLLLKFPQLVHYPKILSAMCDAQYYKYFSK
ncbi:hypothetical protein [Streptococcus massiliensis]|uniref:Uncharacterized protein n=1 Tax=Streptococcus massiliensis TaxID=313439 RepID=A0A380KZF0_9STRE|nr:hypothetical protein [Streptococcus massiliensis]SUN77373.1 Uncharacterised protein [Streptococcus massiliensis]